MQQIVEMDTRSIFSLIQRETAQTIVLVISYLSQEKGSQVLAMFRPELREQIIERLATMGRPQRKQWKTWPRRCKSGWATTVPAP